MKELLMLYAAYNQQTNSQIISLLSEMSEEELNKERNTYFKSIKGLFEHLILGSWNYLNAVKNLTQGKYCKSLPGLPRENKKFILNIPELFEYLKGLDELLLEAARSINNEDLNILKENLTIYNGRKIDIYVREYFLQYITHQVHHQGQL